MKPNRGSISRTLIFGRRAVAGLVIGVSSVSGTLLRDAATMASRAIQQSRAACGTYLTGLCMPIAFLSVPLGPVGSLVINSTSFLISASLFFRSRLRAFAA